MRTFFTCQHVYLFLLLPCLIIPFTASALHAEDIRQLQRQARQALIEKTAREQAEAEKAAAQSRAAILKNRQSLEAEIARLTRARNALEQEKTSLETRQQKLARQENKLSEELDQTDKMVRELVGVIRTNAKDISALVKSNMQSALAPEKGIDALDDIGDEGRFPGMEDIRGMADLLLRQVAATAEVAIVETDIVDRRGKTVPAKVLMLGPFTACYRLADEAGFLTYSPAGGKLYALSRLPDSRMQKQIRAYMAGQSEAVPMDIARGAALQQLIHSLSLTQQIPKGGPIVWPILLILTLGLLIIVERAIFFWRRRMDGDEYIRRIARHAREGDWQACKKLRDSDGIKPLARVVAAGVNCREMDREDMENALQEAILREIPAMERFLSTLGILAAIAPLLGLLGTVTGMIDTFHIITLHGTGDARLMSGGISEALVTTMLGLSVAIPLMLGQTLLNRAADKQIGHMEEKAVALVNIVHKSKVAQC